MSNPIAKHAFKFNIAKAYVPKKGKGSYNRKTENKKEISYGQKVLDI